MAVHFCPAFCVISRATSLTKASKAGVAAATPGASNAALTLSASIFTRVPRASTVGWATMRCAVPDEPVKAMTSSAPTWSSRSPMPPHNRLSAPSGSTLAADHVAHHLVAEPAGGGSGLGQHRHAGEQRAGRLLPQAPAREVEGIDMHGDAVARHQHMDGLEVFGLGQPHRLLVEQRLGRAQPRAEAGVIFQRADAAVDVDGGVDLGVAGIGDCDVFIARAVGDQARRRRPRAAWRARHN